ncbi:Ig-like domain-containing protein [Thalassoroseus pseudoceratinae]|uniref:Ig-like domain-containing protein n=1 Tax=Thalassoroseus pseudoceratinae TaxID=2713176 RepID=UPI0014209963|nr:Ig-like domain-containing protein [Thalassoroseus pseudoceratinae]
MRTLTLLICVMFGSDSLGTASEESPVRIVYERKSNVFTVHGLSSSQLRTANLRVSVAGTANDSPALLGIQSVQENRLQFHPRFPLDPGLTYHAVLTGKTVGPVRSQFKIPAPKPTQTPEVTDVFPSGDTLPENLLKFYLHFSTPMQQGDSYRLIHLINDDGDEVELPFLELAQEMWSPDGTRLTLLLDPGRIKRGLKPREDSGPALEAGREYTLVIDADWKNLGGKPLKQEFRKTFQVVAADAKQPDISAWTYEVPKANGTGTLTVHFDEPLDHALASRVLTIHDSQGQPVPGQVRLADGETQWKFQPESRWVAGRYQIVAETILEDRAGNSLGRPFEVDISRETKRRPIVPTMRRTFTIPE